MSFGVVAAAVVLVGLAGMPVGTTQPLVVQNVPSSGQATACVATNSGRLTAYAPNGQRRPYLAGLVAVVRFSGTAP